MNLDQMEIGWKGDAQARPAAVPFFLGFAWSHTTAACGSACWVWEMAGVGGHRISSH